MLIILEQEYDHLDYTRPASAWKPHYQTMNGFGSRDLHNKSENSNNSDE